MLTLSVLGLRIRRSGSRSRVNFKKAGSALTGALLAGTLLTAAPIAVAAEAADVITGKTGHETSVAYTAGKAQGSNEWGLVGNVLTNNSTAGENYSYGVGINPVTGDLWVSDSGKIRWANSTLCRFGLTDYCTTRQLGQPAVYIYERNSEATDYNVDGTYTDASTNSVTGGYGKQWVLN